MDISKVIVTGGAGFIGSHLVDALAAHGFKIIILDNLSSGRLDNMAHHLSKERVGSLIILLVREEYCLT